MADVLWNIKSQVPFSLDNEVKTYQAAALADEE